MLSSVLSALLLSSAVIASPAELQVRKPAPATTLKGALSPRYFAAALGAGHLFNSSDPEFAALASSQFSGCTPENEMKWETVEPFQNVFNFTQGELIASYAAQHNFVLRGHVLVWHSQLAPWVSALTQSSDILSAMTNHITTVMGHFRSRIYAWDVVNEAINDDATATWRETIFYNATGDASYIDLAFQTARNVKDSAKLYYNDYNIEGINAKSNVAYALVKRLKKKGLIDGVGLQSHFIVGEVPTDLQANIQRFVDLGVEVALTEIDIRTNTPPNATTIAQHAKDWKYVIDACKAVNGCVGATAWGITDLYSWIPGVFTGEGYGLLWDDNYVAKPAYYSVLAG